jgi:hypothetical protein
MPVLYTIRAAEKRKIIILDTKFRVEYSKRHKLKTSKEANSQQINQKRSAIRKGGNV